MSELVEKLKECTRADLLAFSTHVLRAADLFIRQNSDSVPTSIISDAENLKERIYSWLEAHDKECPALKDDINSVIDRLEELEDK